MKVGTFFHLKTVHADSGKEEYLVAYETAHGTDFTLVPVLVSQGSCDGKQSSIGEYREIQSDHLESIQIIGDFFNGVFR